MNSGRSGEPRREMAEERVVRTFLERAASVILESRTLDGPRFTEVLALADELGLSRQQLSCELRFLQLRGVITSYPSDQLDAREEYGEPVPAAGDASTGSTASIVVPAEAESAVEIPTSQPCVSPPPPPPGPESAAVPSSTAPVPRTQPPQVRPAPTGPAPGGVRPTATEAPSESFRRWVEQKLAGYASSVLARDDEQGLIGVGTHRYRLADVLAGHVVRDVATSRDVRLARDLDGASCHSTVSDASTDDPQLKEFFEQAAPILARHRGLNTQSRVLMNAVAQQLGLSQEELDRALDMLQGSTGWPDKQDPRQLERRESYRSYLRRTMAQLPDGIVTFQAHRRLVEAGEHFHGVAPHWIKPTIHEVASEMGVRFVSQEQALQHVATLVQEVLTQGALVDAATRSRIYASGTRWGLDPMDVEAILRRHQDQVRQRSATERRATRWILGTASAAFLFGVTFLVWLMVPAPTGLPPARPVGTSPAVDTRPRRSPEPTGVSWWDDELRIALANARRAYPELRAVLDQIRAADADTRGEAYQHLTDWYVQHAQESSDRTSLEQLFQQCFALEPSESAARQIPTRLLAPALALNEGLPRTAQDVAAAFRGGRVASSLGKPGSVSADRRADLGRLLERTLETPPDRLLDAADVERQALAALARRYYAALVRAAADDPVKIGGLYRALYAAASDHLDDHTLHRLDADFLAALLPVAGERWEEYQDVIRRTARSDDPFVMLKLLDAFRAATDPMLRSYLSGCLCEQLGVIPGSLTDAELVEAVRSSLGVTAKEHISQRWQLVADEATHLLDHRRAAGDSQAAMLQHTVDLTRLATLACGLAQGEAASAEFAELEAAGPVRLDAPGGKDAAAASEPFVTPYPLPPAAVIRQHVDKLASSRAPEERLTLLRMIVTGADSVTDIDLAAGQTLADYLWRARMHEEEYRELLTQVPKLARWNAVRLGVADRLADVSPRDAGRQELVGLVCGDAVDLQDEAARQQARRQLMQTVLTELPDMAAPAPESYPVFDAADRAMGHFYRVQARWLRVPTESYAAASQVSTVLTALIGHLAGQIDGAVATPPLRELLAALPQRLVAAQFVADSEIHYTVMLQHIWLQLLGAHVAQASPAKALAARGMVADTRTAAATHDRAVEQLRDLEAGLLQLWLLRRPDADAAVSLAGGR